MKVEELRIGNWVQWKDHKGGVHIGKVQTLFPEQIGVQEKDKVTIRLLDPDEVQPINLSEFWLDKFWFKKTINDTTWSNGKCGIFFYEGEFQIGHSIFYKYVHQLQNLCYALSGEELTFKK